MFAGGTPDATTAFTPAAPDRELRVTQVYQDTGEGWRIVHRHADPLADPHSIGDILTFAYGDT